MKITFRVHGPEIKKAVVDWARKHLVAAADLRASDSVCSPGAPHGKEWDLTNGTYIDVAFASEHDPGAVAIVRIDGPDIRLAVVAWAEAHLRQARGLAAEFVLHRRINAYTPWSLIDEDDYVYINLAFESEKP